MINRTTGNCILYLVEGSQYINISGTVCFLVCWPVLTTITELVFVLNTFL